MNKLAELSRLIRGDAARMRVLANVRELGLPDCWVAAGFVRNCAWDHLHGFVPSMLQKDIDVIWFDPLRAARVHDEALEATLRSVDSTLAWSVKNQARMHFRNADRPYQSALDAMRYWPETATSVAVRLDQRGALEVVAAYGLDDLFALVIRPGDRFLDEKHAIYLERIRAKRWQATWPRLTLA